MALSDWSAELRILEAQHEEQILRIVIPATRAGVRSDRGIMSDLQNRALLAEVRKELAELENRIIARINGTYVRAAECSLREENVRTRLETIDAGDSEQKRRRRLKPAAGGPARPVGYGIRRFTSR